MNICKLVFLSASVIFFIFAAYELCTKHNWDVFDEELGTAPGQYILGGIAMLILGLSV